MSNVTIPGPIADRLTVKVAIVLPLLPSVTVTSFIVRLGSVLVAQLLGGEFVFRGKGVGTTKSLKLSFVSVQPPPLRKSAVVLLGAGAWLEPSKQSVVAP